MAVMSVQIAPEVVDEVLKDKHGAILNVQIGSEVVYLNDLTGRILDPDLVRIARAKEVEYFEAKVAWEKRMMREVRRVTGKPPITVRWVDVNKGDNVNPNIRSRLVARQIRQAGEDPTFAPTPPFEALRSILSIATTFFHSFQHVRDLTSEGST